MKLTFDKLHKVFFTSDTHAFHNNIVRGSSVWEDKNGLRDFDTPIEMTTTMAQNFNEIIPKDGILFHTGDLSFAGEQNIAVFRNLLRVKEIHIITGNHDQHIEKGKWDHLFTSRQKYLELEIGSLGFCLFHFKISSWNNIRKGWYQLHGHHHWKGDLRFGNGRQMDVGVDGNDLKPYKLVDIIDMLQDRKFINANDHHA